MSELKIGGSNMTVELRKDTLYAEANTGNKQWLAVLTDTHPKYNYEREFVAYQKPKTSNRDSGTAAIEDGAVLERVRYTHSGKNRSDSFYQLVDGEVYQIDEVDVVAAIDGEIVADVPDDDDDGETHECEECGDVFDSEHGLAVHEGIVHSEDEHEDDSQDENEATDTDPVGTDDGGSPVAIADGGSDEIRDFNDDVRHSDDKVRHYRVPGGNYLYAYEEGDEHVVVSRGDEPGTRWTKRIPATVKRPVPGQQRWTIPDNWEQVAVSKRDSISYGIYYVHNSSKYVEVSIPTNDWLTDAWFRVKSVGDLTAEPVGELASSREVREFADEYGERYDAPEAEDDAEVLRAIADQWDVVEEDLRLATEWVRGEGIDQMRHGGKTPVHADSNWEIEFNESVFRFTEALRVVDLPESWAAHSDLRNDLFDEGLLPNPYRFQLGIDDSAIDMNYYIRGLIEVGASPVEALDYYMVEVGESTQTAWADERGVDQSTVSGNVSQALDQLE